MIPQLSLIGKKSNVGKTTILCKIIGELKKRGYRVATIKHHKGDFEIDQPGKDSWKHSRAGADLVLISSPKKLAKIEKLEKEYELDEIIKDIRNVDIIITEGYKEEKKPKIEILRKGISEEIISRPEELVCVISDFSIDADIRSFDFDQLVEIVDLIEERFLKSASY